MEYFIGIDGGGTKTACLFSAAGDSHLSPENSKFTIKGDATNPHAVSFPEMKNRLKLMFQEGMEKWSLSPRHCAGICAGLAGVGRPDDEKQAAALIQEAADELKFPESITISVYSDTYVALRGALPPDAQEGILVISGTGSNSIGMASSGRTFKSGGWGHVLGDEGGGFQIGLKALKHLTRAYDLRGEPTIMTKMAQEKYGWTELGEIRNFIYSQPLDKKVIANFAEVVIEASAKGDKVATGILEEAAEELIIHVESLHKQSETFSKSTPVMVTGSIFTHSSIVTEFFRKQLQVRNLGQFSIPCKSPAEGAVAIAKEQYNKNRKVR
ncbi:N-acetylglucosamine kinase [Evansella clarkii]|uniref:N-acetylglucosamine kinase n=1 Tax=Evansella clarkii TaxID=79879 RepID=UPI000B43489D|nr:BadF/BadG/BcrA/BcrD ATPase family protein [Evansella clarkii]